MRTVFSIDDVGTTKACSSVAVPKTSRMMVTVHSAMNERTFSAKSGFAPGVSRCTAVGFAASAFMFLRFILSIDRRSNHATQIQAHAPALCSCRIPADDHERSLPTRLGDEIPCNIPQM